MNGRRGGRKIPSGRVDGAFIAMPWDVLDSPAYMDLSHPARALLLDLARQYVRDNNGRLLTSKAHLSKRGWNSSDVITRAVRELEGAGFIHQTVKGHRPNKASWWAVTWYNLDQNPHYDSGAAATFRRGSYRQTRPLKNACLRPSGGVAGPAIAPSHGAATGPPAPPHGAIELVSHARSTPPDGNHLETHLPQADGLTV